MFRRKWREKDLYYSGNPDDYVRLVFRRYGRDGSYPIKRGHSLLIILFISSLYLLY